MEAELSNCYYFKKHFFFFISNSSKEEKRRNGRSDVKDRGADCELGGAGGGERVGAGDRQRRNGHLPEQEGGGAVARRLAHQPVPGRRISVINILENKSLF